MPALTRDNVTTVARWRAGATPGRVFAAGAATYLLLCVASYRFVRPDTLFYFTDYWEHRAVVAEVIRHGTSLLDPVYGEAAPSRQFTPWSLALGYLSRLSGWSVDTSLAAGALVVSGLFVSGVHAFARAYYRHRWAPAVLLAALTCAWGIPPLIWTGFHSLRSQLHGNYYPASLVFALTLIAWALTVRLLQTEMRTARSLARATLLVLLVAIALVTHPLNAALLLAGAGALAMVYPDVPPARRLGVLALLGGGVLASAGWPYFNPLAMAGSGAARGQATFNNFGFFFDPMFVVALLWPAGFALAAIRAQLLEPRTRVPAIACIAIFAAYVAGGIADVSVSHRLLAYVALALQLVLVWLVLDVIDGHPPGALEQVSAKGWRVAGRIAAVIVAMQVLLAIQQLVQPWALNGVRVPARPVDAEMRLVQAALPLDARVLGWDSAALVLPSYGVKVVAFPRPMPLSPSDAARQADVGRFFRRNTSDCDRGAIAMRWGATYVAWLTPELGRPVQRELTRHGAVTAPVGWWRITAAPPPCSAAPAGR